MKLRTALTGACAVAGLGLLLVYLAQIWFAESLDFERNSLAYYLVGATAVDRVADQIDCDARHYQYSAGDGAKAGYVAVRCTTVWSLSAVDGQMAEAGYTRAADPLANNTYAIVEQQPAATTVAITRFE